jgi:RpiB/LacA/LacB family sugar-phosphate isomerase
MIFLASDHAGYNLAEKLFELWNDCFELEKDGGKSVNLEMNFLTSKLDLTDDYPDIANSLAQNLKNTEENNLEHLPKTINNLNSHLEHSGIAICGTGVGICMALNRFDFIRAGCVIHCDYHNLEQNLEIVRLMRTHNNANVLCLSGKIDPGIALSLCKKFVETKFSQETRHLRRIKKLENMEK